MRSTRREILTALLGAGLGGACRAKPPSLNYDGAWLPTAMEDAHRFRDGFSGTEAVEVAPVRVLILGSGIAGLSAAWELRRRGVGDFLILEAEDAPGGTARSGRSLVTEFPWGAHYLPAPPKQNSSLVELLEEAGCVAGYDAGGEPIYREEHLAAAPKERVFFRGAWHEGLYPRAGASRADLEQLARFEALATKFIAEKAFAIPAHGSAETPELRALDQLTMDAWLRRNSFDSPLLRWWIQLAARDDFGTELTELSAWYGLHYFCARTAEAGEPSAEFLTWPKGNGFLVDHLLSRVQNENDVKLRAGILVYAVRNENGRARVLAWDRAKKRTLSFVAERVIFALPSFLRARLCGSAPWTPDYVPWMVANLHLSERPASHGYPVAWDNVICGSRSLGYVVATHQKHVDRGPTVWTWYTAMSGADARAERRSLEALTWRDAGDAIVHELSASHLDFPKYVQRIDLLRLGHAMVRPTPGTAFSADRARAASPEGAIHFAHTDLSGMGLFEEAFFHGVRAAREIPVR